MTKLLITTASFLGGVSVVDLVSEGECGMLYGIILILLGWILPPPRDIIEENENRRNRKGPKE